MQAVSGFAYSNLGATPLASGLNGANSVSVIAGGEIDQAARSWQETIDAHKAVLKKATDDPHSAELQTAIDQLAEQRAELLRQRTKLAAIPDEPAPMMQVRGSATSLARALSDVSLTLPA